MNPAIKLTIFLFTVHSHCMHLIFQFVKWWCTHMHRILFPFPTSNRSMWQGDRCLFMICSVIAFVNLKIKLDRACCYRPSNLALANFMHEHTHDINDFAVQCQYSEITLFGESEEKEWSISQQTGNLDYIQFSKLQDSYH